MDTARAGTKGTQVNPGLQKAINALPPGPVKQALLHALQLLAPATLESATKTIGGLPQKQQSELGTLFARAGQSPTASPRADANAERTFLLESIAGGARGSTINRLAEQVRGTAPTTKGFRFNPATMSAGTSKAKTDPADEAVAKLRAAMDDMWGTDEAAVFEVLEKVDPAVLQQVAAKYQKATGRTLEKSLALELDGPDLARATTAMTRQANVAGTTSVAKPTAVANPATAAQVQKNLDTIKVDAKNLGTFSRGNAVDLNLIIPINVAKWKPPKAELYKPLQAAVRDRNKAKATLADPKSTEPQKKAAQAKLDDADKRIAAEGTKIKEWMKSHLDSNPALRSAKAQVKVAERNLAKLEKKLGKQKVPADKDKAALQATEHKKQLDAAKLTLKNAQTNHEQVKTGLLAKVDAYAPMVDVPQTASTVTVDGRKVKMQDGVETPYTNSWKAVDGGAVSGDSDTVVKEQLAKAGITDDRQNILAAISDLEGSFSKVNTWDTGRVSWGFTQWTLGKSGNGTLADFMRDLKKTNPAQYESSFGKYGIDIDAKGVVLTRGDGTVLKGVEAAEAIRSDTKLSAIFMAAGADPAMQQAQIKFANEGKISGSRNKSVSVTGKGADGAAKKATLKVKDVVTSEYATAIMTDLAVNAGSGAKVAADAIAKYVKDKGVDPAKVSEWGPDAEKAVIAALEKHSRASRITHHKKQGFSTAANSFEG
jgi:hypothetical protein